MPMQISSRPPAEVAEWYYVGAIPGFGRLKDSVIT
jgi:hypothetical protein